MFGGADRGRRLRPRGIDLRGALDVALCARLRAVGLALRTVQLAGPPPVAGVLERGHASGLGCAEAEADGDVPWRPP